jgi:hypothetical protein
MGHMAAVGAALDAAGAADAAGASSAADATINEPDAPSAQQRIQNPFVLPFMRNQFGGAETGSVQSRKVYKNKHAGRNLLSTVSSDFSPFIMTGGASPESEASTLATTESLSAEDKELARKAGADEMSDSFDTEVNKLADKIGSKNNMNKKDDKDAEHTVGEADDDDDDAESSVDRPKQKQPEATPKRTKPAYDEIQRRVMEKALQNALDTSDANSYDYKLIKKSKSKAGKRRQ